MVINGKQKHFEDKSAKKTACPIPKASGFLLSYNHGNTVKILTPHLQLLTP